MMKMFTQSFIAQNLRLKHIAKNVQIGIQRVVPHDYFKAFAMRVQKINKNVVKLKKCFSTSMIRIETNIDKYRQMTYLKKGKGPNSRR